MSHETADKIPVKIENIDDAVAGLVNRVVLSLVLDSIRHVELAIDRLDAKWCVPLRQLRVGKRPRQCRRLETAIEDINLARVEVRGVEHVTRTTGADREAFVNRSRRRIVEGDQGVDRRRAD